MKALIRIRGIHSPRMMLIILRPFLRCRSYLVCSQPMMVFFIYPAMFSRRCCTGIIQNVVNMWQYKSWIQWFGKGSAVTGPRSWVVLRSGVTQFCQGSVVHQGLWLCGLCTSTNIIHYASHLFKPDEINPTSTRWAPAWLPLIGPHLVCMPMCRRLLPDVKPHCAPWPGCSGSFSLPILSVALSSAQPLTPDNVLLEYRFMWCHCHFISLI